MFINQAERMNCCAVRTPPLRPTSLVGDSPQGIEGLTLKTWWLVGLGIRRSTRWPGSFDRSTRAQAPPASRLCGHANGVTRGAALPTARGGMDPPADTDTQANLAAVIVS